MCQISVTTLSSRNPKETDPVAFLIYMIIKVTAKFFWWMLLIGFWLCWVLVAMMVALVLSLTGNDRAARRWRRSMNWRRVFWI